MALVVQMIVRISTWNRADLDVELQERDELRPGVAPQPDDCWVALFPGLGELLEPGGRCGFTRGGVDGFEVLGDLLPVLTRSISKTVTQEVDNAGLDPGF